MQNEERRQDPTLRDGFPISCRHLAKSVRDVFRLRACYAGGTRLLNFSSSDICFFSIYCFEVIRVSGSYPDGSAVVPQSHTRVRRDQRPRRASPAHGCPIGGRARGLGNRPSGSGSTATNASLLIGVLERENEATGDILMRP